MARKPQVAVEPRRDGRWAVQTDGRQRADSLHDKKSDAIRRARELAIDKSTELVIKSSDGRISDRDSYGNDPRRIVSGAKKSANTEIIQSKATVFEEVLKRLAKR